MAVTDSEELAQVQADLAKVQAASMDLVLGKRVGRLTVGAGELHREYEYQELTIQFLQYMEGRLKERLAMLSKPLFRDCFVGTVYVK